MSFDALDISASALYAQRVRMDTISSNIANVNTTRNPDGTPGAYRRKQVVFSAVYDKSLAQDGSVGESTSGGPGVNPMKDNMLKGGISLNSPGMATGVQVSQIAEDTTTPIKKVFNPSHPDADKDGYVSMPNVNVVTEMVDMIAASRAYEANVTTIDTTKNMFSAALRI